jgi:hypothetical protein
MKKVLILVSLLLGMTFLIACGAFLKIEGNKAVGNICLLSGFITSGIAIVFLFREVIFLRRD